MKKKTKCFNSISTISKIIVIFLVSFNSFLYGQDSSETLTDIDGNVYRTVKIGNQWWMAENLKVTHYRNGDPIPNVKKSTWTYPEPFVMNSTWTGLSIGAYCVYDNNKKLIATYGLLYNWYALKDDRNIAPEGWHVPTLEDWIILIHYLGGDSTILGSERQPPVTYDIVGGKMKETGTEHWNSPNIGATNESGFSALSGGGRDTHDGQFRDLGKCATFWSATDSCPFPVCSLAWNVSLYSGVSIITRSENNPIAYGYSVRLIKD